MKVPTARSTILTAMVVGVTLAGPATTSAAGPAGTSGAPPVGASGGGQYLLALDEETMLPGTLAFGAVQHADGTAHGQFLIELDLQDQFGGGVASFRGRVTCLSVDEDTGRAWIGGVVTANTSTNAGFRDDETTQVGDDIWFRVLDDGRGPTATDRTTFAGFEGGGGILTSQEYCDAQLWPDDNDRTHPITTGQVQVRG